MTDKITEVIMQRIREGDQLAFARLIEMTQKDAYRMASRYTGSTETARDLVQEAYLKCWISRERLPEKERIKAWILTTVRNLAIDHLRREGRHRSCDKVDLSGIRADTGPGEKEYDAFHALVCLWVSSLPKTQRQVFMMRDLEDMKIAAVMEATGLSEGSVKTNLYHARKKLHQWLKNQGYQP